MLAKVKKDLLQIDPQHKWNLSHTKVNKGTLQEREQAKIIDVKKKKFKIVWEKIQHRPGSICN